MCAYGQITQSVAWRGVTFTSLVEGVLLACKFHVIVWNISLIKLPHKAVKSTNFTGCIDVTSINSFYSMFMSVASLYATYVAITPPFFNTSRTPRFLFALAFKTDLHYDKYSNKYRNEACTTFGISNK